MPNRATVINDIVERWIRGTIRRLQVVPNDNADGRQRDPHFALLSVDINRRIACGTGALCRTVAADVGEANDIARRPPITANYADRSCL